MPLIRPSAPAASASDTSQTEQFPTLQTCARPNFVSGHNDWLQISSPTPFPHFDICPDCYNSAFRNTRYGSLIAKGPPKPENVSAKCAFSGLWERTAYWWLFIQQAPDLNLLGTLARVQRDEDGACPNMNFEDPEVKNGGKGTATRRWHCLRDPRTTKLIEELTVCSDCVFHVEHIFPSLKGMFEVVAGGQKLSGMCDLMMLGHGQERCIHYLERIMEVAKQAEELGFRDISSLAEYVRTWASVPFCKKGANVVGEAQYSLPTTVPDFTACEECYMKHVQPLMQSRPRPTLLSQITSSIPPPGHAFMCDLYSPRLQQYFREVCATNDIPTFRRKLAERNDKMREIDMQLGRMKQEYQQLKAQSNTHMSMMHVERMRATSQSTAYIASRWIAPPMDWSATNALMNKANQLSIQAAGILDKMTLLEKQWNDYWR
ncbi:hypothetical protein BKA63DRAFT_58159 [Paraphoma chrysanthemicola]|nr:hypothetical protein BKA63DRAFT_58159 [Paraphoma chrysanthemicola]